MSDSSLRIETRTSGIWQTNSVVLSASRDVLVLDPAFFPRELDELAALAVRRGENTTVVFSHGHWDHVAGWRHFPGARVLASAALVRGVTQNDAAAARNLDELRDFEDRWYVQREAASSWPAHLRALADGETLRLGHTVVNALAVPGHSADAIALLVPEAGLLLPGDYLSACEIPFVDDLPAYRATLLRFRDQLPSVLRVVPGHGPELDREAASAILEDDLRYLEALAACAVRRDAAGALAVTLPRAADVPGMAGWHRKNCAALGLPGTTDEMA
jgi:glyoxylase-like metal-dependent hydrolase (beta-lactamase superfamily II)